MSDIQGQDALFSSASVEWGTPRHIFDALDAQFHFTLDAAARPHNAKCNRWYGEQLDGTFVDGLAQDWSGEIAFVNPPYSRQDNTKWARKVYQSAVDGATVVGLVPARTDTRFFNDYYAYANEIWFVDGRVKFVQEGKDNSATFPSAIVVFDGRPSFTPYANVKLWKQPSRR